MEIDVATHCFLNAFWSLNISIVPILAFWGQKLGYMLMLASIAYNKYTGRYLFISAK